MGLTISNHTIHWDILLTINFGTTVPSSYSERESTDEENANNLIRSRLFLIRDHIHFSGVCKSWRLINPLVRLSGRPLLLFTHKRDEEKINLPYWNNIDDPFTDYKPHGFSFSSQPMSPDFIVFCICNPHNSHSSYVNIYIYRRSGETWTKIEYQNHLPFLVGHSNPVYHDGLFYCLALDRKLGVFYPSKSTWTVFDKPRRVKSETSNFYTGENYMVESNAELLSIFTDDIKGPIHVFQLDRCEMLWLTAKDFRNRTLFVSHGRSLSVAATKRGMENKIYFPMYHRDFTDNCLFYSMETKSFTLDFHMSKKYVYSIWIYN
ncbi:F-box/kelch-repeat protein At1g57790-like [Tasmannia lanceolata]|uniref:F-box/kelch-repeat protein At1g57790-like n=1 Tax=Tasmannia lanceolata TaxID=3420 RepID=UPI00406410DA